MFANHAHAYQFGTVHTTHTIRTTHKVRRNNYVTGTVKKFPILSKIDLIRFLPHIPVVLYHKFTLY